LLTCLHGCEAKIKIPILAEDQILIVQPLPSYFIALISLYSEIIMVLLDIMVIKCLDRMQNMLIAVTTNFASM
jgi:hypothetical protein